MTDETHDEEPDVEVEFSKLGGEVTRDGVTVQVHIYRISTMTDGWALEVVALDGTSTTWEELFPTEQEALDEFERTALIEGLSEFMSEPDPTVH